MPAPMTTIRVPAPAYAALRDHAARFSTRGARHSDGAYRLAVSADLLEHLTTLALPDEALAATILSVLAAPGRRVN